MSATTWQWDFLYFHFYIWPVWKAEVIRALKLSQTINTHTRNEMEYCQFFSSIFQSTDRMDFRAQHWIIDRREVSSICMQNMKNFHLKVASLIFRDFDDPKWSSESIDFLELCKTASTEQWNELGINRSEFMFSVFLSVAIHGKHRQSPAESLSSSGSLGNSNIKIHRVYPQKISVTDARPSQFTFGPHWPTDNFLDQINSLSELAVVSLLLSIKKKVFSKKRRRWT